MLTAGATALLVASLASAGPAEAQDATGRFYSMRGDLLSPAYEGWWPNEDGSFTLFFGYFNSNWEQTFDIPIGPDNYFALVEAGRLDDPGSDAYDARQADQGQPTHFYPRRNPFLFTVDVPADFGDREWVWTLRTKRGAVRAYATLSSDYRIDPQVISTEVGGNFGDLDNRLRDNKAPDLAVEGALRRTVRVGEAVTLVARANDPDNYPPRSSRRLPQTPEQLYSVPTGVVVQGAPGLRFSWTVYRGPATAVSFSPVQLKAWMDSRVYANSPWSPPYVLPEVPPEGRYVTQVTFHEPGEYTLRGVASDGSMFTYQNVTFTVTPLAR
jgi:hypothetical protein